MFCDRSFLCDSSVCTAAAFPFSACRYSDTAFRHVSKRVPAAGALFLYCTAIRRKGKGNKRKRSQKRPFFPNQIAILQIVILEFGCDTIGRGRRIRLFCGKAVRGSDSPPGCHSLPLCLNPLLNFAREKPPHKVEAFLWQGQKDSNPQRRFWRPTCYHYTMPLRIRNSAIIGE